MSADARLIGYIPGVNMATNTNPYATPADPTCVPVQATDKQANRSRDHAGNPVWQKDTEGTDVCNSATVPERLLAPARSTTFQRRSRSRSTPSPPPTLGSIPTFHPRMRCFKPLESPRLVTFRSPRCSPLVKAHTDDPEFGFLGEKTVNVLDLNLALNRSGH